MRIGILGGTFNPIHNTHLAIAQAARDQLNLDRVIFIPAKTPPHKPVERALAPAEHRLRMVELAVAHLDAFEVSDLELKREGPSYTVDTLNALRRDLGPGTEIFFIVGTDQVMELPTWHRAQDVTKLCRLVPVERPGFPLKDIDALAANFSEDVVESLRANVLRLTPSDVSATTIRQRLAQGEDVTAFLPPEVLTYIRKHDLYR